MIVYEPYPQQELVHSCPFTEVLMEGNRGGGKSDCAVMDYLGYVGKGFGEAWQGIIFRREIKDLKDLIKKSRKYIRDLFPTATFNKSERTWYFDDGETLTFQIGVDGEDYWSYHGQEYPWQFFDELTSWADDEFYLAMASCCRSAVPGIPKRRLSATNPWGAGHSWVKKRFIDAAPRNTPIKTTFNNPITDEEIVSYRVAVNFDIAQNKHLLENDKDYMAMLDSITNQAKRKAWIDGDWSIQVGAFFGDCWSDMNIVKPFDIPSHWLRIQSYDHGFAKPFSVGWFAVSDGTVAGIPRGALVRYREWYGCVENEPDTGLRINVDEIARGIQERENGEKIDIRVGDPAIWQNIGMGETIGEQFMRLGFNMIKGDNARIQGWERMRRVMKGEEVASGKHIPMLFVFNTCLDTIRIIPVLLHDLKRPEDLNTTMEDHIADEMRYGIMTRYGARDKAQSNEQSLFARMRDEAAKQRELDDEY
ncbi:MAG: putative terminase large subunit [Prokaryotic dsDNA virus sp.]|nr:MAG: putative terminase large subunit [Prokaryotic dsDNA virus sp.]